MPDIDFTDAEFEKLLKVYKSGVSEVEHRGRRTRFRSVEEINQIIGSAQSNNTTQIRRVAIEQAEE